MPLTTVNGIERFKVAPVVVQSSNPAVNTELSLTVTTGQIYELYAVSFSLVTDSNTANRAVTLIIDDGTNTFARIRTAVTQAASLTYTYTFAVGLPMVTTVTGTEVTCALPGPLPMAGGYRIRTSTANIQAGDDYGVMSAAVLRFAR